MIEGAYGIAKAETYPVALFPHRTQPLGVITNGLCTTGLYCSSQLHIHDVVVGENTQQRRQCIIQTTIPTVAEIKNLTTINNL